MVPSANFPFIFSGLKNFLEKEALKSQVRNIYLWGFCKNRIFSQLIFIFSSSFSRKFIK